MIPSGAKHRNMVECPDCEAFYDQNDDTGCRIDDYTVVCANCAALRGWAQCAGCSEWKEENDLMEGCDCEDYCESCWSERFTTCEDCNETFCQDEMVYYDDCSVCESCADERRRRDNPDSFCPRRGTIGSDDYTETGSERCFGVELETHACDGYGQLQDDPAWGAKNDCSVCGKEFFSAILKGDNGLAAIDRLCDFADDNNWEVDSRCGYHAHFDMREEDTDSLKAIALAYLATYDVWSLFVNHNRLRNSYCGAHDVEISELWACRDFSYFSDSQDRYQWINFCAYNKFQTFEVRLHEGSLDGCAVKNWVRGHATFMDWAAANGWNIVRNKLLNASTTEKLALLRKIWTDAGCADLADYYEKKAHAVMA